MSNLAAAYQVELLRNDIEDVNSVVLDIVSRVGPLQQSSWKYPDKNGYELHIHEILQKYNVDDVDENEQLIIQTALLELLIDRFLLTFHALASIVDQRFLNGSHLEGDTKLNSKSAGLTVRQYWRKIASLLSLFSDLQKELLDKDNKIQNLQASFAQKVDTKKAKPSQDKPTFEIKQKKVEIANENCARGTQTLDTAFRPCESCSIVQEGLRSVLDCISNLAVNQHVPSSVAKFKKTYEGMSWLSATDLQRLVPELSCDLDKIQRQWSWLFSQLDPLRLEIDRLTKTLATVNQDLQSKKAELASIHAVHSKAMKESETKWNLRDKDSQSKIADLSHKSEKLSTEKNRLLEQVELLNNAVNEKQRLLEEFQRLQNSFDGLSAESQVLNEHLVSVTSERDGLRTSLSNKQEELNRTTMMVESMRARCEGLQAKQDSLLEQMSEMDRFSDDYRIKVSNLEGQLDATREHLEEKRKELEQLKQEKLKIELELDHIKRHSRPPSSASESGRLRRSTRDDGTIADMQNKLLTLQNEISEYRHKEMLLLAFPDPNGPLPYSEPSGDICVDLERQISATELRSQLLQNQASQLEKSLVKLRETKGGQRISKSEGGPRNGLDDSSASQESFRDEKSAKLFSKRSTTFVVRPSIEKGVADDVQLVQEEEYESIDFNASVTKSGKTKQKNGGHLPPQVPQTQQPIQLWRVPLQKEDVETQNNGTSDQDAVAMALLAYRNNSESGVHKKIGFSETGTPPRSRSNSYGRPDARLDEAMRQAKARAVQEALATQDRGIQLPSLPPGKIATSAANSIVSRAMNRQTAMTAELRLKAGLGAGKSRQQQNAAPPQRPSSPYGDGATNTSHRLTWDLFSCPRCSKTYSNQRDLDIHSAYCNTSND